jgi:predicted RNA binding protein YcfA (HicA-like mRNA interferase family)
VRKLGCDYVPGRRPDDQPHVRRGCGELTEGNDDEHHNDPPTSGLYLQEKSMPLTALDIITMLERDGALAAPDASPWPTHEGDVTLIDWTDLFPGRVRGGIEHLDEIDPWQPPLDEDFLGELAERAGTPSAGDGAQGEGAGVQPDVCAWYQPLHFHGLDWGIFIKEECLLRLALEIAPYVPYRPRSGRDTYRLAKALIRAAFAALFLHEQYHHKTESYAVRLHVVERVPRYVPYFNAVYKPLRAAGSDDLHEEALANADSFWRLPTEPYARLLGDAVVTATLKYLVDRFPFDPPGYRRAMDLLNVVDFDEREFLLKSQVQEGAVVPFRTPSDWLMAPRINQSFFTCRSDIWTIVRPGAPGILPAAPPYPAVSTKAMIKALRQLGYDRAAGGKGSHVKLVADGQPPLILPGDRKDLSPVVLRNAAKALGYRTPADLAQDLGL